MFWFYMSIIAFIPLFIFSIGCTIKGMNENDKSQEYFGMLSSILIINLIAGTTYITFIHTP